MRIFISAIAGAAALVASASAADVPQYLQDAIANPNRSEENRARDGDRKPGEVLAFFGVKPGMRVVDIASSGGYFTEIIAGAVGPDGEVRAHNTAGERFESQRAEREAQYAPFGNIVIDAVERGAPLPYEDDSVDMVLLSLIIHHLHYTEDSGENMPESSAKFYAEVRRVLKPGGVFAVVEHKAADGSSRAESASWHRIPEALMDGDVTSAGFTLDAKADDIHYNADDDLKNVWYETGLRGKTTRLVHRYKSPD